MRRLALLVLLLGCQPASAGPLRFDGPAGTLDAAAPGDSLRYSVTGPTVTGATQYLWTVTAAPGAWTGLPTGSVTTSPVLAFTAIAPASWDSVTFAVSFQGKSASRSSNTLSTSWKVRRSLLATGPLVVDSSAVGPISFRVAPSTLTLAVGPAYAQYLCAFWQWGSGHATMRSIDAPNCTGAYQATYTAAQRSPTVAEQGWMDGFCDWPTCLLGFARPPGRAPADAVYVRRL